jgi:two-component system LytT family response regulator
MKAIIVEDELNVREGFMKLIQSFCPEVDVIATAESVESGIEVIRKHTFDVLFLDINLPDGSGFDLIYRLQKRDFKTVFVTAYDHYALDAFKISAVDYLLKPVSPDLLIKALDKININDHNIEQETKLNVLQDRIADQYKQSEKIILSDSEKFEVVDIQHIIYCEANSSYTIFHFQDGSRFITSTNLKEYERILSPYGFTRSHHSILVNLQHVKSLNKADGGSLILSNDLHVALSKRKKSQVIDSMKSYFVN